MFFKGRSPTTKMFKLISKMFQMLIGVFERLISQLQSCLKADKCKMFQMFETIGLIGIT